MPLLELKNISYAHGKHVVVDHLSFQLEAGEIGCLLGPSGCGKTTVLRCIAGFEHVGAGEIVLAGGLIGSASAHVPAEERRIGMVFQDYALFPHLSVGANIGFGLRGGSAEARSARVAELLETVGLAGQDQKYPHELSGGQQQRVALARALAPRPRLLLLDEPFSNLDVDLRERLAIEVRDILKAEGTTAILVTHDQHEAFALADQIGVMNEGRIQQWDAPYELYHRPVNRFVADFVGQGVFLPGTVIEPGRIQVELGVLPSDTGTSEAGTTVRVLLRPDDVVHDDASEQQAEVVAKAFRGAEFMYTLTLPSGELLLSLVPSHHNHAIGEQIGIRLAIDHVVAFPSPPLD
ncbi:ABC transporter ATP-binding protein [Massilia cavernae]|uniref:ABC transporter ATP-binding protein n=1 Tax=Massilia cavernae TaxID=2320864 RepID=A0A418XEL6_9BURK|nr:ABC transporter ATP-binding protein [Massilia cavernae]RJG10783.1 ABC transporter ATP-binding protein [Massilia cavernae]